MTQHNQQLSTILRAATRDIRHSSRIELNRNNVTSRVGHVARSTLGRLTTQHMGELLLSRGVTLRDLKRSEAIYNWLRYGHERSDRVAIEAKLLAFQILCLILLAILVASGQYSDSTEPMDRRLRQIGRRYLLSARARRSHAATSRT